MFPDQTAWHATRSLRRLLARDAEYVPVVLRHADQRGAWVQEFFHRLKNARLAVVRFHQLSRRAARRKEEEMAAALRARSAGNHKRHRFHIKRMNKGSKRQMQEAFLFMEAFYWNASRAVDCAIRLELVADARKARKMFDAVLVRHLRLEHQEDNRNLVGGLQRPSMSFGQVPVLKPGGGGVEDRSLYSHAVELAEGLNRMIDCQIDATRKAGAPPGGG